MWCHHVHTVCKILKSLELSCNVIGLLFRLAGFPPFWHRKQLIMLRRIMNGQYEFVSPEWDDLSDSSKDLVK